MLKESELLRQEINKKSLYNRVKEVSSYHRIQASTGFREAAQYCKKEFDKMGIESTILEYEANPDVWYCQNKMFKEWDLKEAWLRLKDNGMVLADASCEPISVVQKSYPYDFTDGCEIVYIEENNPEKYKEVDLKGKIIFIREDFNAYMDWAIKEKGAIGFISDYMAIVSSVRTRENMYESLKYTSFWWKHTEEEPQCFGFVLSPKMGDVLADICKKQKEAYERNEKDSPYVSCYGKVDTALYNGKMEVVEAKLPGESDEEVLLCAHLCHPKCSCNDNASGVAAVMESMRVIKRLMDLGKFKRNKRTIKAILVPELYGTAAYLSEKKNYKNCVGAINMDMVGGKQTRFYGPITLTSLPYSTPSFINDLTAICMEYAGREQEGLSGDKVCMTNHKVDLYTGGSDHVAFSDPTIGVPCCMIGQWPDLHYHTATDTLDVIDPEVLSFSTHISSLYAYTLSNLNKEDAYEIQNRAHVSLMERCRDISNRFNKNEIDEAQTYKCLKHVEDFYHGCVEDYKRVLDLEDAFMEKEKMWISTTISNMCSYLGVSETKEEDTTPVYIRDYAGYLESESLEEYLRLYPEAKEAYEAYKKVKMKGIKGHGVEALIPNYIDGKRTIAQVIENIECDIFGDCKEMVYAFIALLEAIHLIHKI